MLELLHRCDTANNCIGNLWWTTASLEQVADFSLGNMSKHLLVLKAHTWSVRLHMERTSGGWFGWGTGEWHGESIWVCEWGNVSHARMTTPLDAQSRYRFSSSMQPILTYQRIQFSKWNQWAHKKQGIHKKGEDKYNAFLCYTYRTDSRYNCVLVHKMAWF